MFAVTGPEIVAMAGSMLAVVVAAWRRGAAPPPAPPASSQQERPEINLNHALETVLVKAMDSQAGMMERVQRLNIENAQMAVEANQRRWARKGGAKRNATGRRTKAGTYARDCRLCEDPLVSDPTVKEIIEHATHRTHRTRPDPAVAYEQNGNAVIAHVDERDVQTAADGRQQVECAGCGDPEHHHA